MDSPPSTENPDSYESLFLDPLDVKLSIPRQNLLADPLLLTVPRFDYLGSPCPALGSVALLAELGKGGMGAVYYGIHLGLGSEVAVKVLPLHMTKPESIRRFIQEAQLAGKIPHPHLIAIKDIQKSSAGLFYMVMEYVCGISGQKLIEVLRKRGKKSGLAESEALKITFAAAQGLSAAHGKGIIHRDLKPGNVLIPLRSGTKMLDYESAKIADLGLARDQDSDSSLTQSGWALGSPGFMAPEQIKNAKTCGKPADIYGLTATFYALLTGRAPHAGTHNNAVMVATVTDPHTPIRELRPDISKAFESLIERNLSKDPKARCQDAAEYITALEQCRAGKVSAPQMPAAHVPKPAAPEHKPAHRPAHAPVRAPSRVPWMAASVAIVAVASIVALKFIPKPQTTPGAGMLINTLTPRTQDAKKHPALDAPATSLVDPALEALEKEKARQQVEAEKKRLADQAQTLKEETARVDREKAEQTRLEQERIQKELVEARQKELQRQKELELARQETQRQRNLERAQAAGAIALKAAPFGSEAERSYAAVQTALASYRLELGRVPVGAQPPVFIAAILERPFNAWAAADKKYLALKIEQLETLDEKDPNRRELADELLAFCAKRVDDEVVLEFALANSHYLYFQGCVHAALGDEDKAKSCWEAAMELPANGIDGKQIPALRKLIVLELLKLKMRLKKYNDVEELFISVKTDASLRGLLDEDAGKELPIDYARAVCANAEVSDDYEKPLKELHARFRKETMGSPWAESFALAMADTLLDARSKRLRPQLKADEWHDAAAGFHLRAQKHYAQYEKLAKSADDKERADAPQEFEAAYMEFARAVDYYRRTITVARQSERTDLVTRLEVEPKAWFGIGVCYVRMKHDYEALISFRTLHSTFGAKPRAQWMPKAAGKPVVAALGKLDAPDGLLANSLDNMWLAIDANAKVHTDAWNLELPNRMLQDNTVGKIQGVGGKLHDLTSYQPAAIDTAQAARNGRNALLNNLFSADRVKMENGAWGIFRNDYFGARNGIGRRVLIKRHGGSILTENAVDTALRWLANNQETDGHWDAKKHRANEKTDTAVTAFSLLAFLGAGHTERIGEYKENVKRAVAWLKSKQAVNGMIWDRTDAGGPRGEGYPCAIATLAIAEAAGMGVVPETREAAQRAVNYCTEIHQSGEGTDKSGWRYHAKEVPDTSVTCWFVSALKSARAAGLNVNHNSFDGAIKYLDSVEHTIVNAANGRPPVSTYWYLVRDGQTNHRLTAIGTYSRQLLGWKREDLQTTVEDFVAKGGVPTWGANGASVDLYYWYYGTLCAFQQGGEVWKRWNEALSRVLTTTQRKEGEDAGSWDRVGMYSTEWGRAGQTALSALCLEVYYRYQRTPDK